MPETIAMTGSGGGVTISTSPSSSCHSIFHVGGARRGRDGRITGILDGPLDAAADLSHGFVGGRNRIFIPVVSLARAARTLEGGPFSVQKYIYSQL